MYYMNLWLNRFLNYAFSDFHFSSSLWWINLWINERKCEARGLTDWLSEKYKCKLYKSKGRNCRSFLTLGTSSTLIKPYSPATSSHLAITTTTPPFDTIRCAAQFIQKFSKKNWRILRAVYMKYKHIIVNYDGIFIHWQSAVFALVSSRYSPVLFLMDWNFLTFSLWNSPNVIWFSY